MLIPDAFILGTVISCLFIAVYYALFAAMHRRPRLISLILGALPVSLAAVLIESMIISVFSAFVFLVVLAPIIEELLKFSATAYRRDMYAGLGVGLGFALSENALYFGSFMSAGALVSLTFLAVFILLRGMADPVLHLFTTALSTGTWRKRKPRWLGVLDTHPCRLQFRSIRRPVQPGIHRPCRCTDYDCAAVCIRPVAPAQPVAHQRDLQAACGRRRSSRSRSCSRSSVEWTCHVANTTPEA